MSNRIVRMCSFQRQCAKEMIAMESYHHPQKFAQARRYLPTVTRIILKKKMGDISTICLRPFVRGKSIVKTLFLSICCTESDKAMCITKKNSVDVGMGYLEHDELRV